MDIAGSPDHIEDVLARLHSGQWFGWSDSKQIIPFLNPSSNIG